MLSLLQQLRAADRRRPSLPGEHLATFGAALGTWRAARGIRSPLLRSLVYVMGGALAVRAMSGRDGVLGRMKRAR